MPFREPNPEDVQDFEPEDPRRLDHENRVQESEVRHTAQHILMTHLRPDLDKITGQPTNPDYWSGRFPINLTGATLISLNAEGCHLQQTRFANARLLGDTSFEGVNFLDDAIFELAEFTGFAVFSKADFKKAASFKGAHLYNNGTFRDASFQGGTDFSMTAFNAAVGFNGAQFKEDVSFEGAHFDGGAKFDNANFDGNASFEAVYFDGDTRFRQTHFAARATFWDSVFDGVVVFNATFANAPKLDQAYAEVGNRSSWPDGWMVNQDAARLVTTPGAPDRERAPLVHTTTSPPDQSASP